MTDAISLWQDLYRSKADAFTLQYLERTDGAPPLPNPNTDSARAELLKHLIVDYNLSFERLSKSEVLTFSGYAYPVHNLRLATESGNDPQFLSILHRHWEPTFLDWAHFLWEFTGSACELFADIIFLMPAPQRADPCILGKVLFRDLPILHLIPPTACASIIGALLLHPFESTYVRFHEEAIHFLSELLKPFEVGFVVWSLLRYRSRHPACRCGYRPGEVDCTCAYRVYCDHDKRYAAILMKLVLDRYGMMIPEEECRWTETEREEFLHSATVGIFSNVVLEEIMGVIQNGFVPDSPYTPDEPKRRNSSEEHGRSERGVEERSAVLGVMWCMHRGCERRMRSNCVSVSCARHCRQFGRKICRPHKMLLVTPLPLRTKRRRVSIR